MKFAQLREEDDLEIKSGPEGMMVGSGEFSISVIEVLLGYELCEDQYIHAPASEITERLQRIVEGGERAPEKP